MVISLGRKTSRGWVQGRVAFAVGCWVMMRPYPKGPGSRVHGREGGGNEEKNTEHAVLTEERVSRVLGAARRPARSRW